MTKLSSTGFGTSIAIICLTAITTGAARSAPNRGADVPFSSHEAEECATNGTVVRMPRHPARDAASPEIEASARAYVRLDQVGEYCEITASSPGNALVLRHCLPDAPQGGGTTAALALYVNDKPHATLRLDSRHNWLYGDIRGPHGGQSNDPTHGHPRVFWNESRFRFDDAWEAGDKLRLQIDDATDYCSLDLIDTETAPQLLDPPRRGTYLSVVDFGAVANDESDDTQAIEACIAAAKLQQKTVWLPAGRFLQSKNFKLDGVQVQGAGMWHTELIGVGRDLGFYLSGSRPAVADLFIESRAHHSRSDPGGRAFHSKSIDRFVVENVWITHAHNGFWLAGAKRGRIRGCRVYFTYADAINVNRASSNNLIENNYIRSAGDDGIATLSEVGDEGLSVKNRIRANSVIANWWGHNIDVAGGSGHVVEDNYLADNSHSACFTVNHPAAYPMNPLKGLVVRRNTIVRGGGNHAGQQRGAIWTLAGSAPLTGVLFQNNTIRDSIFRAIHLHGGTTQEIVFKENRLVHPEGSAVRIDREVTGRLTLRNNSLKIVDPRLPPIDNQAGRDFELIVIGATK